MALLKKIPFLLLLLSILLPTAADALKPAPGVLLVAGEGMVDPRFRETVILLLKHDGSGSIGLILNRPTHLTLEQSFPQLEVFENLHQWLWLGGPVATGAAMVLIDSQEPPEGAKVIFNGVHVAGVGQLLGWIDSMGPADRYRIYAGYAGWGAGQLASELRRGDWTLKPADPATIFSTPGRMWQRQEERPGPLLTAR